YVQAGTCIGGFQSYRFVGRLVPRLRAEKWRTPGSCEPAAPGLRYVPLISLRECTFWLRPQPQSAANLKLARALSRRHQQLLENLYARIAPDPSLHTGTPMVLI